MMELEIKRELGELDLSTQELSVNYIDRVTVRHRKGPIFRTIAGIFVGTIVGVITADAYCKPIVQQEDFDSWCYQGIPVFFGTASAVTGIFALLPMPKVNINFNRNQHKNGKRYLKDFKKRLNPYAILQN